ncbi:glutamate--cysteine ligase [Alkalimarinus alittae]|uniref:Glutamate--cysteine ligase n=1 Tax=Alkalimarinus alittae TaxID=2961619 RepID=A0ABY6N3A6_9ALTE|nr:glutamate--cysteine ligase [Alkalimarinus alittae]UZE96520.1 glutamate--cysteine ligase [Alkalimarinus alittae]
MINALEARLELLSESAQRELLNISHGIEKEGLRADSSHFISQTNHPKVLGHTLTHPQITTDYSEALMELITPVSQGIDALMKDLGDVHHFVQKNLGDEVLWSGSMPCKIDGNESIRIAEFGDSNLGKLKHVYRKGLDVRYGRVMQSIAGLHYNFSLPDAFWKEWQVVLGDKQTLQDFKSEQYFSLIRNFRRHSWLLMYLFGASPAVDQSFLSGIRHPLQPFDEKGTWFLPYATSLRMGDLGYQSSAQSSLAICFNSLSNFTHTLEEAIHKPYPAYELIGTQKDGEYIQLNTNILQIENEYYSAIRPKRNAGSGEKPIHALKARGVEYIEVRCLDLNPYLPLGINAQQARFMDAFLVYCLVSDSPVVSEAECQALDWNFETVVNRGREPGLKLKTADGEAPLNDIGLNLLDKIERVGAMFDEVYAKSSDAGAQDKALSSSKYQSAITEQRHKINQPELTPSANILSVMRSESLSWLEIVGELSFKHQQASQSQSDSASITEKYSAMARESFLKEQQLKAADLSGFSEYMTQYLS